MATRIRLRRTGRKKQPEYRIVVAEKSDARDGRFVETIGHYNPRTEPVTIKVDIERARTWIAQGATPSETVRSLLKQAGVFQADTPAS
jgi:small subunit ribosomal protein S16